MVQALRYLSNILFILTDDTDRIIGRPVFMFILIGCLIPETLFDRLYLTYFANTDMD